MVELHGWDIVNLDKVMGYVFDTLVQNWCSNLLYVCVE